MHEITGKSMATEAEFTKKDIDNEWNINFLPKTPLGV